MLSVKQMENIIGWILILGTLFSALLVLIGGGFYLWEHGGENFHLELLQANHFQLNISEILTVAFSFSPLGLIELGLISLIATQILRVAMLAGFYAMIKDYWFTAISLFILFVLLYSFLWRN